MRTLNVFWKYGGNTDTPPNGRSRLRWKSSPEMLKVCLLPSLCSLQNRHLFLFQAFAALIQGQIGLCSFSSWQLFPYNSAQLITLGKSSQPCPALQQTPWESLSHCQTRDASCQPLCFSLHLVMNLRTGPSLCVPHASRAYIKSSSGIC